MSRGAELRIAIVSASYVQGLSYGENVWAEEMARLGHVVRVFTAAPEASLQRIPDVGEGYDLQRIKSICLPRHIYFTRHLGDAVVGFQPDLVLWFGVPMYFGAALYRDRRLADIPTASFFSLNVGGMHAFDWRTPGLEPKARLYALAFLALRGRTVVAGCLRSQLVVANTPETRDILMLYPRGRERALVEGKIEQLPLGFSPHHFGWDAARRGPARAELGVAPDEVVIAMSSRFAPNKQVAIEISIKALQQTLSEHPKARALLIGLADNELSRRFEAMARGGPAGDRFHFEPFAGRERLSALFHAADIAMFARPSISCQEALGTGVLAAFADDGSMTHLLRDPSQGRLFPRDDVPGMARVLGELVEHVAEQGDSASWRTGLAEQSRWLGYDRIADTVFEKLQLR